MDPVPRIISTLADDEDFRDLLVEFVGEIPERIESIANAVRASDLQQLRRIVHQLKGACGGYGFQSLTEKAGQIEFAIDKGATFGQIAQPLAEFVKMLGAATADPN